MDLSLNEDLQREPCGWKSAGPQVSDTGQPFVSLGIPTRFPGNLRSPRSIGPGIIREELAGPKPGKPVSC